VQARRALEGQRPWQGVLQRWPTDTASWDLQWDLAREALLKRQWSQAATILASLNVKQLPAPLAARQLFWQGYSAEALGNRRAAEGFWRQLQQVSPAGYYGWRGGVRLGQHSEGDPRSTPATAGAGNQAMAWQPLASGDPELDALWRVGQSLEAWETWRHRRGGRAPQGGEQLLLEGRLRTGVGDDWTGLGQLELANLRLPQASCAVQWQREQQLHPRRYGDTFEQAANDAAIDPALLLGVAKQESRFSAGVASPAGAVGLLQLMPATASELEGAPLDAAALREPRRNARLGARYLRQLLDQWQGNSFLAIASYNAGPGAVQSWLDNDKPNPLTEPELWTEAIPYPETRLYTKKVLGNLWTYRRLQQPGC
jgi:soluble lytic murein transglycosylase